MDDYADPNPKDVAPGGGGSIPLTSRPEGGHGGTAGVASNAGDDAFEGPRRRRRTSLAARGQPMVWLTGGMAGLAVVMIAGLLLLVIGYGFGTFWPAELVRVTHQPRGEQQPQTLVGEAFRDEPLSEVVARQDFDGDGTLDDDARYTRTLWRTGNGDITAGRFDWTDDPSIIGRELPEWFLSVERDEGGPAYGEIEAVAVEGRLIEGPAQAWAAFQEVFPKVRGLGRDLRGVKDELGELGERQREAQKRIDDAAVAAGEDPDPEAQQLAADAQAAGERELAELDAEQEELEARRAEIEESLGRFRAFLRTEDGQLVPADNTRRTRNVSARSALDAEAADRVAIVRFADFTAENSRPATADDAPMGLSSMADAAEGATLVGDPDGEAVPTIEWLDESGQIVGRYALPPRSLVVVADGAEVNAGRRVAVEPNAITIGQIVRAYPANQLGFFDKIGVYGSRWWEFLTDEPRDANQEGGVWPAIVGTVLLTFIMIVFAVPIGVVAAIYLREYATQGPLTSLVRISVNNLAGVPSIVYGVFGLGFFVYGVGGWVDGGAAGADVEPLGVNLWLLWIVVAIILVAAAIAVGTLATRGERGAATDSNSKLPLVLRFAAGVAWAASAAVVFYFVFARVPEAIFPGFFAEQAARGEPEFKEGTVLWASLTLALLTLPVVIVATEEALAAVPRSMREGSYACGASKWQTIQRIVLPRALPGIMTGAILAISRGAGEVAPIMLVGALKKAGTPINGEFPFVHVDQAFMHLGFHIFDLGFQSPDAEASRSMVYTTTLLLILIVLVLNLAAIFVRSRLRRAFAGGQF